MKAKGARTILSVLPALFLFACAQVPAEIADFVTSFSVDEAIAAVKGASLRYEDELMSAGASAGTRTIAYDFSKADEENLSSHYLSRSTGSRIEQDAYPAGLESTLAKRDEAVEEDGVLKDYDLTTTKDGETAVTHLSREDARERILRFFRADPSADVAAGGLYFGDMIRSRITHDVAHYAVDEEEGTLLYDSGETTDKKGVTIRETYTVDELGMLLKWSQALNDGTKFFRASMSVEYVR